MPVMIVIFIHTILLLQSIMADRLTDDFLKNRDQWISELGAIDSSGTLPSSNPAIITSQSPILGRNNSRFDALLAETTRDVEAASIAVVGAPTDPFHTIINSIDRLRAGINSQVVTVRFTRKIFTILLSHRIPMELCWIVFEYLVYSQQLKHVLLKDLMMKDKSNERTLCTIGSNHTMNIFIGECDLYLSKRRRDVSEVTLTQSSFLLSS